MCTFLQPQVFIACFLRIPQKASFFNTFLKFFECGAVFQKSTHFNKKIQVLILAILKIITQKTPVYKSLSIIFHGPKMLTEKYAFLSFQAWSDLKTSAPVKKHSPKGGTFCVCEMSRFPNIYHRFRPRRRKRSGALPGYARLLVLLCTALSLGTPVCASESEGQPPPFPHGAGLFSWSAETVNKTDGELFELMKQQELTVLYQNFSSKNSRQEQMSIFVESAMKEGITVYYLTGDPKWGLDPSGDKLCEAVEEAAAYNRRIERKFLERRKKDGEKWETIPRLAGIVLDVEPYTLKEWDKNPGKVMDSFVSGMKEAYALAQEFDLEVIVCIPWYYDKKGQVSGLEELIKNGCDSIAVMNYYRGAEIKNIITETELAQKHGKGIITIYELQKADGRGVKEINTYYNSGLAALKKSYAGVLEAYPGQAISIAYHDYRALKEVLKK